MPRSKKAASQPNRAYGTVGMRDRQRSSMYPGEQDLRSDQPVSPEMTEDEGGIFSCCYSIMESIQLFVPEAVNTGHMVLAFALNLFVLLTAEHCFQMMPIDEYSQAALFVGSLLTSYYYMSNMKTYDIFNFEEAFVRIGGEYSVLQMERTVEFYNKVHDAFASKYRGIAFRWKLVEKAPIR